MASPYTWATTTPADTDIVSQYPALARARQSTLGSASATGGVLGTLIPTVVGGTPTIGWRVNQDFDQIFITGNAWFNGTAWTFDNTAKVSHRIDMDIVNDRVSWYRAPASANPPVFAEMMRLSTASVSGLTGVLSLGTLALGTNPAASGAIRMANATAIEQRNAANSADLQVMGYTAGNVLQIGDIGAAAVEVEALFRPGTATIDLGATGNTFRNLFISGTIQNATATMGMQFKKGTGAGDYAITADNAYHDVDNTNLKLIVTIPTGWKLAVWAQGDADISATQNPFLAIADGGTVLKESEMSLGNSTENFQPLGIFTVIAGDGASHTVTMQAKTGGGTLHIRNSSATIAPTMLFLLMPSN